MKKLSPNGKYARNAEIKALFASGVSQPEIGRRFGLSQGRVSAITTDRLPPWRRCLYCPTRCYDKTSVCRPCFFLNKSRRRLRTVLKHVLRKRIAASTLRYSFRVYGRELVHVQRNLIADYKTQRRASVFKQPDLFL